MDFDLSDTQRMMQQSARTFLAGECPSARVRNLMASDTAYDPELWSAMAEQGWQGLVIDEAQGGLGLGAVEAAVIAEEMGRACLPGPFLSTLWATAILQASGGSQSEKYLKSIAVGELRATVALLEPSLDWGGAATTLVARREKSAFQLTGQKLLVSDAAVADLIIVVGRLDNALALFAVETQGMSAKVRATPGIDPTRKLYELDFAQTSIPAAALLAEGSAATAALAAGTRLATVVVCAELVGGMHWTLDTTTAYVQTREQFGKQIGSFQTVQHQLADVLLWLESGRSALYYAAWALAENDPSSATAVSIAKAYLSDAAREVGNRGIQLHGGIGFTWEHDLHLYYKRAKGSEYLFGDSTHHRELLAQKVLDGDSGQRAV